MGPVMLVDPGDFTPEALRKIAPACGEGCAPGSVELVAGDVVYPGRHDLASRWYWRCECGARCGVHPNLKPMGSPAGAETRRARMDAHAAFDPMWQKRARISKLTVKQARGAGYKWLAAQLGIDRKDCHIAEMDAAMARRVVEICRKAKA